MNFLTLDTNDLIRKLRNRLAQRTFRRRQAASRRKQQSGADLNQPCNEVVKSLQEENASLRNSLIDIQSKLARLTATMSSLSVKVSKDLGESVPEEPSDVDASSREYIQMGSSLGNKLEPKEFHSVHPSNVPYVTPPDDSSHSSLVPCTPGYPPTLSRFKSNIPSEPSMESRIPSLTGQIPNIWTFDYQMGNKTYLRALLAKANSQNTIGWTWTESNSPISDHMDALLNLLKRKVENMSPFSTITLNMYDDKFAGGQASFRTNTANIPQLLSQNSHGPVDVQQLGAAKFTALECKKAKLSTCRISSLASISLHEDIQCRSP